MSCGVKCLPTDGKTFTTRTTNHAFHIYVLSNSHCFVHFTEAYFSTRIFTCTETPTLQWVTVQRAESQMFNRITIIHCSMISSIGIYQCGKCNLDSILNMQCLWKMTLRPFAIMLEQLLLGNTFNCLHSINSINHWYSFCDSLWHLR